MLVRASLLLRFAVVASVAMVGVRAQTTIYEFTDSSGGNVFGASICVIGDVDLDGFDDVLVGAPGYWNPAFGHALLYSGRDGSVIHTFVGTDWAGRMGYAVAAPGDVNHDGHADALIATPYGLNAAGFRAGKVELFSGADYSLLMRVDGLAENDRFGWSVAGAGDVNADGTPDFIVGAPDATNYAGLIAGTARVCSGVDGSTIWTLHGTYPGGLFGYSVSDAGDNNGDGYADVVVGAPFHSILPVSGSVRVYSGADGLILSFFAGAPGEEIGLLVRNAGDVDADGRPDVLVGRWGGAAVRSGATGAQILSVSGLFAPHTSFPEVNTSWFADAAGDIDADGHADIVVGMPYVNQPNAPSGKLGIYSGATGSVIASYLGVSGDQDFGRAVTRGADLNHDGEIDLVAAGPSASGTALGGVARVILRNAPVPTTYCTAKLTSLGCIPKISTSGVVSLSVGTDNFVVSAVDVLNNVNGILFWGYAAKGSLFGGGTLCVAPPVVRTPVQNSAGNPPPVDCSGTFSFHFSRAYVATVGAQTGTPIYAQYWNRDSGYSPPNNFGLTNAASFSVLP